MSYKPEYENFEPVVEPVPSSDVSLSDKIDLLLLDGGVLEATCSVEEFNEVFVKYKPERRACKLDMSYDAGTKELVVRTV